MNIWNTIVKWFKDYSERTKLVNSFNESARESYVLGVIPALLQAKITKGDPKYKHTLSKMMFSGFRIKVISGRQLTKEELISVGNVILNNGQLVRRLIVMGWDTLEIHSSEGRYGCKWKLTDYESINLLS